MARGGDDDEIKKGPGCLFWGCSTVIIAILVLVAVAYYGGPRFAKAQVEKYLSDKPAQLPSVQVNSQHQRILSERIDGFISALEAGSEVPILVLTEYDVNVLIATHNVGKALKDKLYVSFADDHIAGQVSLPVKPFLPVWLSKRLPVLMDKYLNGTATLLVSTKDGLPCLSIEEIELKGQKPPKFLMKWIRKPNILAGMLAESEAMKRIARVSMEKGQLLIEAGASDGGVSVGAGSE